ncbi:hypothetical protein [Clostridium gasigenes]|uniref:hypothetical protein n=1 Tax=Clostridium gasigenes TaxID=94869 RepID=UPI001C0CFBB1|nr:hypothetical protein [Clostridium gasigenes]MBU3107418.1 hypothetical protein [Clostridium gasigenes]
MYSNELEKKNFIEENLKYSAFREILINQYLDKNEYEEVLRVSEEGEVLDSKYRGLVDKWKKYKCLAYKNLNEIEEQKKLAKELFLSNSSEFYEELKKLYKDQWYVFYKELKDEFEERKWNTTEYYANMLIKENDLAELLSFVANDVSYIEQYAQILINEYKEEVNEIYKLYIESMAYGANDRKKYKKVCKVIIRYRELYAEISTIKIIENLRRKYNKKPAFIDELGRINSKK